jgi:hypothetical protein
MKVFTDANKVAIGELLILTVKPRKLRESPGEFG